MIHLSLRKNWRTSLVVQWLRIPLPMQGTWVRSLVWVDSTSLGATKPAAPQLLSLCSRAGVPRPLLCNKRSHYKKAMHPNQSWPPHRNERKPRPCNGDPAQPPK